MMALRTLRLQLRFLLPLAGTLVVAAYLAVPLMDQVTLRWFSRDLNSRGALVANTLSDAITEALQSGRTARLRPLFERAAQDERLFALGLCGLDGRPLPGLQLQQASQEHGVIETTDGAPPARIVPRLPVGTRLRILPNHACATAAQFDHYEVQMADGTQARWPRFNGG